jgi:hypothetical protein
MRIKMLKNAKGSPNGYDLAHFEAGQEYDTTEALAKCFIEDGAATAVEGEKGEAPKANKAEKVKANKAEAE